MPSSPVSPVLRWSRSTPRDTTSPCYAGRGPPLAEHRIAVAQFEYNHRYVLWRFFLRDAFEFLLACDPEAAAELPAVTR